MNIAKSDGSIMGKKVPPTVGVLSAYASSAFAANIAKESIFLRL